MSLPSSELFEVQSIAGAGRGVVARSRIAANTLIHVCPAPVAHVIFRQYRKEVCAQCFLYDRGRTLPTRDSKIGKVFCTASCRAAWEEDQGDLGRQAWTSLQSYVQRHIKAVKSVADHEPTGPTPEPDTIDAVWAQAVMDVKHIIDSRVRMDASVASQTGRVSQKRLNQSAPKIVDPDLMGLFLSAVLMFNKNSGVLWESVQALALDEHPYKSQYDLDGHCESFVHLISILPAQLLSHDVAAVCRLTIHAGSLNAFGIRAGGEDSEEYMGYSIYPSASYFNHSCRPNVTKKRIGRAWTFTAESDIAKGNQCCITYLGGDEKYLGVHERRGNLKKSWGFVCACERCVEESCG